MIEDERVLLVKSIHTGNLLGLQQRRNGLLRTLKLKSQIWVTARPEGGDCMNSCEDYN